MNKSHLILPLMVAACLPAQLSAAAEDFEAKTYAHADGKILSYRIHIPRNQNPAKKLPLILLFHGAGERGDDNLRQLRHGGEAMMAYVNKTTTPVIILAPQCPNGKQWVDTPWGADSHTMPAKPSETMQLVIDLLAEVRAKFPVDETRIYVTGLSMGGFGTWDILQRMPETFAAAMPVCGGGDSAMAVKIKDIPIRVFHGGIDTVVKTKRSQDMVAALKAAGSKVEYTEYEGIAHDSWTKTYADDKNLAWLLAQKK